MSMSNWNTLVAHVSQGGLKAFQNETDMRQMFRQSEMTTEIEGWNLKQLQSSGTFWTNFLDDIEDAAFHSEAINDECVDFFHEAAARELAARAILEAMHAELRSVG